MRLTFLSREKAEINIAPVAPPRGAPVANRLRVGYEAAAFDGAPPLEALSEQFPQVGFERLADLAGGAGYDVFILALDATDRPRFEAAAARVRDLAGDASVIVALRNATLESTRVLLRHGAADVLTAPVGEAALGVSLERLLTRMEPAEVARDGRIIAMLKAGGGVGATSLAVQCASVLAERGVKVCVADLDVQFGSAAVYLDLPEAATVEEVLAAGQALQDISFASSLAAHRSGVRVLAAPRGVMALEAIAPNVVDTLLAGLRRAFEVVIVDLPSDWTAWTNRALRQADRIVLVTRLSVAHALLTKRQLQMIAMQQLAATPLTLAANQVAPDKIGGVSVSAVQRAIGRNIDLVIPEDARLMADALNQGVAVGDLRRGSKLEKALRDLAETVCPTPADVRDVRLRR